MSKPHSIPQTWAKAAHGWSLSFFQMRVYQCTSIPHLRAAVTYEVEHDCREERIKRINKRIARLK